MASTSKNEGLPKITWVKTSNQGKRVICQLTEELTKRYHLIINKASSKLLLGQP